MNCRSCGGEGRKDGEKKPKNVHFIFKVTQLTCWLYTYMQMLLLFLLHIYSMFPAIKAVRLIDFKSNQKFSFQRKKKKICILFFSKIAQPYLQCSSSPEGPVQWSVPADEGTGGKQQEPQHGEAKVNTVRRVHAEQGQAAKHVDEKCACVNWEAQRANTREILNEALQ